MFGIVVAFTFVILKKIWLRKTFLNVVLKKKGFKKNIWLKVLFCEILQVKWMKSKLFIESMFKTQINMVPGVKSESYLTN